MSSSVDPKLKPIVVVGSINADIFIEIDRLPAAGETLAARGGGNVLPGGKGANQAVAAAKLLQKDSNRTVYWAGRFGNDSHAGMLKGVLTENGVGSSLASTAEDTPSGQAYILLQKDGQNSIIIVGAANQAWPEELPEPLQEALKSAACVMLQREIPERVNLAVAKLARAHDCTVFLDMGGEESAISGELLKNLDFLTANETELARIAKMPTDDEQQVIAACESVSNSFGIKKLLITLGSRGALFFDDKKVTRQETEKVKNVVDTTGAGDCFRGAFVVAYLESRPIAECLKFASLAAAICIQTKGAMPSMPERSKIKE